MEEEFFRKKWNTLRKAVEKLFSGADSCHDFDHTLRVLHTACLMAEKLPEADMQVVRTAALLHDIGRAEEDRSKGKRCHAVRGADLAEKLLLKQAFPPDFAAQVAGAIRTHRYRGKRLPETLEAQIVYDADKLDSLGAAGIGRAFLFAGENRGRLHNTREEALAAKPYSADDTAYREYLVKLRLLADAMQTPLGREWALERKDFMDRFFQQLDMETQLSENKDNIK